MGIENPVHLLFIGVVALLVLGPRRLPELARRLGDGVREFRAAIEAGGEHRDGGPEQPPQPQHQEPQQHVPAPAPSSEEGPEA
jgi:TatA/E family protein of Tat protein translocase